MRRDWLQVLCSGLDTMRLYHFRHILTNQECHNGLMNTHPEPLIGHCQTAAVVSLFNSNPFDQILLVGFGRD